MRRIFGKIAAVAGVLLLPCLGGILSLKAQEIASVRFEQKKGTYTFDESVLRYNIASKAGTKYNERTLNDDIKRLHAMGMFSDVVTETKKTANGKIAIIFRITPQQVVSQILFEGNKAYDTKVLSEKVSFSAGVPLNTPSLQKTAAALREFYRSKGLNEAVVTVSLRKDTENKVKVVFVIQEKLRYRVGSVTFPGAKAIEEGTLRDAIHTRSSFLSHPLFSWFSMAGLYDRELLERDKVLLREEYKKKGLLDFRIKNVKITEEKEKPEILHIAFEVEEGKPYNVDKVMITGAKHFPVKDLEKLLLMKKGDVYSSLTENKDVKTLENKYYKLGYADLNLRVKLYPDYLTRKVDVEYLINEGPLYKIHAVNIIGNRYTKDHVIRRELPILPGEPVDMNKVKLSQSRVMGMGLFKKVEANAIRSEEGPVNTKDVHITVQERRFLDAKIGGSWSDSDGLAGMLELSHSNMDILDPSSYFTGGGQRMRAVGIMGLDQYGFELDFTEPWLFGIPLRLDISGYLRNNIYEDWEDERLGFSVTLTKRIFDEFTTISGGYTFEQVRLHDMEHKLSYKFREYKGRDFIGRMHLSLTRDTRDSALDPRRGYFVNLYASLSSKAFGGSEDYVRLEASAAYHYPFFHDWFVFTIAGKLGTVSTFNSDPVPLYDRYFLGGGDSVRGFPYRSIGPADYNKDNYGGEAMYILTTELSHPIYKDYLRGAVFMDMGGCAKDAFEWGKPNIGIGYGVRIKLPQLKAPIRLDLAFPVLNQQKGVKNSLRFHFSIGASFSPPQ